MSTKPNYTALDAAIMRRISEAQDPYGGNADKEARKLEAASNDDPWLRKHAFRFIDSRLQALRKAGRVRYQRKPEGWVLA